MPVLFLLIGCSENAIIPKDGDPGGTLPEEAPDIVVDPLSVDFGEVVPGASASAFVTVSNVGDAALTVEELSLAAGTPGLSWTALSSPVVPPGQSVDTVLTWAPTLAGPLDEQLRVPSNDPDEPRVDVALTGSVPWGDLVVTPDVYEFGSLDVGTAASVVLTVSNVGRGPVTVSGTDYVSNDADLRVLDAGALTTLPAVLDAGASTEVLVQYIPSAPGSDEGAFSVFSDDPDSPTVVAQQRGTGADDPCDGFTQTVTLMLTADDAWQGWIDATSFSAPNQNTWNLFDTMEWELPCGDHTLALYATDTAHAVAGVIAVVSVEGSVRFVSGPTNWTMVDAPPPPAWTEVGFDDSAWNIPQVCADTSLWGTAPQPFYDQGAQWIWWTTQCRDLGEAWLRLNFTVP
jgi:hypothetical protein